ncbi:hypothetical protein DE146DRAFT_756872 [Phaeosphaeria sp. MPI-PUGE-AT-0046c]|nr:hypothetical protein DE146DRAFT_756872 [Phaeosphaeria sp. MPI-PUGE-AT-0046c]
MMLLASVLPGLLVDTAIKFTTNSFDKIGFDLDHIGRQRETAYLSETVKVAYDKAGIQINVAIWNMHIPEVHHFDDIIETALSPMGKGGGFRIVVFRGDGYLRNDGALGLDNWRCSGHVVQEGRLAAFKSVKEKPKSDAKNYLYEMPGWLQWGF